MRADAAPDKETEGAGGRSQRMPGEIRRKNRYVKVFEKRRNIMKRKFLSLLISLCMVLTMVPTAFAETEAGAGNTADTETSVTGLPEAGADGVITLTENVEISSAQWPVMSEGLTIDLQQYTLTISGGSTIYIPQGQTLTIKNGKIIANEFPNGITAVFSAKEDASIILNSVQMMTNGSALFPAGNAASVEVTDSEISAGTYA